MRKLSTHLGCRWPLVVLQQRTQGGKKERDMATIRAHSHHLCMNVLMQTLTHVPACTEQTPALCMYKETLKYPSQTIHLPPLLTRKWSGGIGSVVFDQPRLHLQQEVQFVFYVSHTFQSQHPRLGHKSKQNLFPLERVVDL